jgi:hypothetical protein
MNQPQKRTEGDSPRKAMIGAILALTAVLSLAGGCYHCCPKTAVPPLGTLSDDLWRRQEIEAAASDFVICEHEFASPESVQLNVGGQDHLKAIAARLQAGAPMPVVIERSMSSVRPDSTYHYPVNPNPELDMCRRNAVARALQSMGVGNAEQCVVVAPALAEGYTGVESARAYDNGMADGSHEYGGFAKASVHVEAQECATCNGDR